MSDWIPKAGNVKVGGLGRAAQKLQAAREKAANKAAGIKPTQHGDTAQMRVKDGGGHKKTAFQRKSV